MSSEHPSLLYRFLKRAVRLVYRPFTVQGLENLPEESCVIVSNHAQLHGPLSMELYAPRRRYTWCVSEMMSFREVSAYAYKDFWSNKPVPVRPLYKLLSYLIAPLAWLLFNNADVIPVYRDKRVLTTFTLSCERLAQGADVVIFPECYTPRNTVLYDYQPGFTNLALYWRHKTRRNVCFVPMYICPALKKILYGKPTSVDFKKPIKEELERVRQYLMEETTALALSLPPHRVVPYPNMAKKDFPMSKQS